MVFNKLFSQLFCLKFCKLVFLSLWLITETQFIVIDFERTNEKCHPSKRPKRADFGPLLGFAGLFLTRKVSESGFSVKSCIYSEEFSRIPEIPVTLAYRLQVPVRSWPAPKNILYSEPSLNIMGKLSQQRQFLAITKLQIN